MITKESLARENLGIMACCAMVAVNLGIALVALVMALMDDGPPHSPSAASTPPTVAADEANYNVPANPYAPSSSETAGLVP